MKHFVKTDFLVAIIKWESVFICGMNRFMTSCFSILLSEQENYGITRLL